MIRRVVLLPLLVALNACSLQRVIPDHARASASPLGADEHAGHDLQDMTVAADAGGITLNGRHAGGTLTPSCKTETFARSRASNRAAT